MTSVEESQLSNEKEDLEFDTQKSILFSYNVQEGNDDIEDDMFDTSKSIFFQGEPKNQDNSELLVDNSGNEEEPHHDFFASPQLDIQDYSPTSRPSKTVKLFSGEAIALVPRALNKTNINETQYHGMYMDMDSLTTRANLRNSIKEQNRKRQTESAVSTNNSKKTQVHPKIWTEKYKPNSFIQLCSAGNDKQYRLVYIG